MQHVPDGAGRVRASTNGGAAPVWSPVKNELYYVSGDTVMAAVYRVEDGVFRSQTPRALVRLPERASIGGRLECSPDGRRFLLLVDTGQDPSPTELHVTMSWPETLKSPT